MTQSEEGPLGQFLGAGHGAPFLGAIDALGGRSVCVESYEGVGGEPRCRQGNMESAGKVSSQVSIGLEMGG